MLKRKVYLLLFFIVLLAGFLRFYKISTNPPGLNSDEVAIGYNAYSILKTGHDEYNQSFPLAFRSFDDYKPPLYIYMTVPSVALFGLNAFAVRFPSAALGTLAILIIFFLTRELLRDNKLLPDSHIMSVSLLASLLLAISPWHLQFTRTAYETGSLAFFTSLGLLLFLKGRKNHVLIVLSAVVFGLETYLYQAARVFVPAFLIITVLVLYFQSWRQNIFRLGIFAVVLFLVVLPNLVVTFSPHGLIRFQGTSVFQNDLPREKQVHFQTTDWLKNDNKSVLLFHSGFLAYLNPLIMGYLSHFRPDFLVTDTGNPKVSYVPGVGLMYLWELPFLLLGFHYLLSGRSRLAFWLLLGWVMSAPIGAAVTNDVPSSVRTAAFLPSFQILTAVGLGEFFLKLRILLGKYFRPVLVIFLLFVLWWLAYYLHMLTIHAPVENSQKWYYGYQDVVSYVSAISPNYNQIVVSTSLDEPYIFFLFFEKYDPVRYQKEGGTVSGGFAEDRNHYGKYLFKPVNWSQMRKFKNTLFVGLSGNFPSEAHLMKTYYYLDGTPSISLAESEEK